MTAADKTAAERAADAAATLAYSATRYHDAQRVMVSPAIALRATAAELVRVVVGLASDDGIPSDEVARSLAVALGGAMRGLPTAAIVARLRATADWLERQEPIRVDTPEAVPAALATVQARRVA